MLNPNFPPKVYPVVSAARLNAIVTAVQTYLATNAAVAYIDDAALIALASEFSATPGTLKAVKDRLNLS